jgi:hypothetical protein
MATPAAQYNYEMTITDNDKLMELASYTSLSKTFSLPLVVHMLSPKNIGPNNQSPIDVPNNHDMPTNISYTQRPHTTTTIMPINTGVKEENMAGISTTSQWDHLQLNYPS